MKYESRPAAFVPPCPSPFAASFDFISLFARVLEIKSNVLPPDFASISIPAPFSSTLRSAFKASSLAGPLSSPLSFAKQVGEGGDEGLWHAVDFKTDCPHVLSHLSMLALQKVKASFAKEGCSVCKDPRESWYCLLCAERFCGRYINGHAEQHSIAERHALFLGFVDLSVWCYRCEQYVEHPYLMPVVNELHVAKFGEPHPAYTGELGILADDEAEDVAMKPPAPHDEKGHWNEKD